MRSQTLSRPGGVTTGGVVVPTLPPARAAISAKSCALSALICCKSAAICADTPVGGVTTPFTTTVTAELAEPPGLVAVRWYVVVTVGDTVTEVLLIAPMPLSIEVELAFDTTQERTVLCPAVIAVADAPNDVIVGTACGTTALQVLVATVDDASVARIEILRRPGA